MANQTNPPSIRLDLPFNPKHPTTMHIDLNSCFATIEQQANPKLRGKPVAVAAYNSPAGCIVAPSIEAKRLGIKTGMRVKDGKMICPSLIVLEPDPRKYRIVHLELKRIISTYTDNFTPRSIDEFVLDLEGMPAYNKGMTAVAQEIKQKIKEEIGEYLVVSIGIAPNRFLAKLAAGLHKPDGLDVIDKTNYLQVYAKLQLMDLHYIKKQNTIRLNNVGIFTPLDFYRASPAQLKSAFQSVNAYYWYQRLRGWEVDYLEWDRKSFGNSFALPKPLVTPDELAPILQKLVEKTGARLRKAGYKARGVHVSLVYRDWDYWHQGMSLNEYLFDSRDIYKVAFHIMTHAPKRKPVRELAESVFGLQKAENHQLMLFEDLIKKDNLTQAIDTINDRWGGFVITPARMIGMSNVVLDRIAFGGVKELEEVILD